MPPTIGLDGTAAFDDSAPVDVTLSQRATTLLTKVLLTDSTFAPVREALDKALTDHGRAVLRRIEADLACQILDVHTHPHECSVIEPPICYCNAKDNRPHTMGTNGCAYA